MKSRPLILFSIISVLLTPSLKVVAVCPSSYTIPENLKRPFINVASATQQASCTATSEALQFECIKALDENTADEYKVNSPALSTGSSLNITFAYEYLVNTVSVTQLQGATTQIEQIKISFDNVNDIEYINLTRNAASQAMRETFSFSERLTKTIKLTIMTLHDGSTGHGYKSIEVTNGMASIDKLCDYSTVLSNNVSKHIGIYSDTVVFGIIGTEANVVLSTSTLSSSPRYVIKLGAVSNTEVQLDRYGPPGADSANIKNVNNKLSAANWRVYSIDFSTSAVALIIGNKVQFKQDDAGDRIQIKYVSFSNPGSTSIKVLYCNREVKCYKDARHFWPLDKPNIVDVMTGKVLASNIKHIKPGPTFNSITSAAISLTNNKLNLGNFAGKCLSNLKLCTKGITVSFWFNIAPVSRGVQTLLSTDTASPGIQINFDNNEVHVYVYDGTTNTYAKGKAKKDAWIHVTVTWHPKQGMVLMTDFNSQSSGTSTLENRAADTNTALIVGAKNDLSGSADASISSLVIWEKSLDSHYVQKIGVCAGFSPVISLEEGNISSKIVPYDFVKATSDIGNTKHKAQLLYDDGTRGSGAWQPSFTTPPTYVELDFGMGQPLAKTATQGGNNLPLWVKSYTLSYSWDGQEWTDYKVNGSLYHFTANSDSNNIVSHLLCPKIEARLLRFHPVTWNTNIAMRVGILVDGDPVTFKGCYISASIDLTKPTNDVEPDELQPGRCVTSCGFQSATYAGLSKENRCYCFDVLPSNDVSKYKCNEPCNGDPSFKCGSRSHVSVYEVRGALNQNFVINMPDKVNLLTPFKASSPFHHRFSVDFGDGITFSTNSSEISYFVTAFKKRTVVANTWTSKYGSPKQLKTLQDLDVQWYLNGSKITYRTVIEAGKSFLFHIAVNEGGELKILRTKSNGEQHLHAIPDAMVQTTLKLDSTVITSTAGPRSQNRLFVLSNSVFTSNGVLKAFTVSVFSPGYIKVQIHRPVCIPDDETTYCYSSGVCSTLVAKCTYTLPNTNPSCTSPGSVLCSSTALCTENNLVCPAVQSVANVTLWSSYEVVHEVYTYVKRGQQFFLARNAMSTREFGVRTGDLPAIVLPANTSAEISVTKTSTKNHYQGNAIHKVGDVFPSSTLTSQVNYPNLQATYVVPSTFAIMDNCSVGAYHDVFNFSSSYNYEVVTARYICTERVQNVTWTSDLYQVSNTPINITVLSHPGFNVTHSVEVDNTTAVTFHHERVDRDFSYPLVLSAAGNYTLTLIAFNLLGAVAHRCVVIVIERIATMELVEPPATKLGDVTQIQWTLINGTDTQCNATLGDGNVRQTQLRTLNGVELFTLNYTFLAFGEYVFNLTCFNRVSSISNHTIIVVEVPVSGLIVNVNHVAKDIEVNETIEIIAVITQGTNPMALIDFGDGTLNRTGLLRSFKTYPTWGFFKVNVTVYNKVSSMHYSVTIQVHKPVFPVYITHTTSKDTNFSQPTPFMLNISSGNDFTCDWDFGDGVVGRGASNVSLLGTFVYHIYNLDKCFFGEVNCSNRLYSHRKAFVACVYHPITNLTFLVPSAHASNLDLALSFQAALGTNVSYSITWERHGSVTNVSFSLSADSRSGTTVIPQANFPAIGIYFAELSATNKVTRKIVVRKSVYVEIPIQNLCGKGSHVYIAVGHTVQFYASVDAGSNVTIIWDFKDGFNQSNIYRGDTLRLTGDNVTHSFAHHGTYAVLLTGVNPLGGLSALVIVHVQYPVQDLTITTSSPQIIPLGQTWFVLTVPAGIHPPTNATIDVDYEQNGVDRGIAFGTNGTSNFSKIISVPGLYFVTLIVRNEISDQKLNTTIDVQREMKDLVVMPAHTDGYAGFGAPGRGAAKNVFPREYPIRFNASTSDGSNVTFFVSYGDGSTNVTQFYNTSHQYAAKGTYTISVVANNSVSQLKCNTTLINMDSNVNLTFDNDSPTEFTDYTVINVLLDKIGDDACCLVDLTNNTYRIYKDKSSTTCKSDWAGLTSVVRIVPSKNKISIAFAFKFWQMIYYPIKTYCHNTVSFLEELKWALITPLPCDFPSVDILGVSKTYSRPTRFYLSEKIKTYSDVLIICYASRESNFEWEIHEVDASDNRNRIAVLSPNSITNRSILELPERSLPYGKYVFHLNVSMVGLPLVFTAREVYAEIIPSPLQCFVYGGNGWSQSIHRDIILNGQFSFDPDENPSKKSAGMRFFLYCKKQGSNYTFPDNPVTDSEELARGGGGCLQREAGLAANGLTVKTYKNGSFRVNDSLQFRLYCLKGFRLGSFDVFIKMTEIDPPHCDLTMDGLTLKRLVISTAKVTIEAICKLWNRDLSELQLFWTLHKNNNISQWDTQDIETMIQSRRDKKYLVIRRNVLEGCASYMAKLRAQFRGGPIGYTYIILDTQCPPRWGECSVTPTIGTTATNFSFTCENWKDSRHESNLLYYYHYNVTPYNLPVLFAKTGKQTLKYQRLLSGLESFNYEVDVRIDVIDKEGAVSTQTLRIKVEPQDKASLLSPCTTLRRDIQKDGHLVKLEMEDNSQNLNAWCSQNLQRLNSESKERFAIETNLTSTLREIKTFLAELPTLDPPGTPNPKTADVQDIETQLHTMLTKSQACCKIRERLAKSLANIQLDSFSTVQMTSASMFFLASNPDDQCFEAQVLLVAMLRKMSNFFRLDSASANFNQLFKAMASFEQAAAGILHVFDRIVEKPNSGNVNNVGTAKHYSDLVIQLIRNTTDSIQCCIVENEFPTEIFTPELNYTISKNTLDTLDGLTLNTGSGKIILPDNLVSTIIGGDVNDTTTIVTSKCTVFLDNPFTGDNTSSKVNSMVSDFKLENDTNSIRLENLTKPLELWIQKRGSLGNCYQGTLEYGETQYHQFSVALNESSINIDVFDLQGLIDKPRFAVSLKRKTTPNEDDVWQSLPRGDGKGKDSNSLLFSNEEWNNTAAGAYYVAVKYNRTQTDREISEENGNNALIYSLCAFTSECIYWDKALQKWTGEGCKVGPDANLTHTQCLCTHATSFASDFVVPPNKIDWGKISLSELFKNFLVTGILLSVVGLYFLLLIPARRQDIKDLEKIGVIPIPSNDPRDTYGYEVCLYTGFQGGNGTTAEVSIIISGSSQQTQPRVLTNIDGRRSKFYRGAVDSFLVTTPHALGQLGTIRIWHNHGGNNPSWFLSRLYIRDLQNDKKTWYICNRWLAVEEDDGKIERVLHSATNKELTSFNLLFSTEARKNLSDSHLWFSVYYRPPHSTFTRVQRLSCCLCILLSTMLANAMFYQTGDETPNAEIRLGPIRLSTQQISIAITSSLVVLPINLLIMNLFRKARPKNPLSENALNKYFVEKSSVEKVATLEEGVNEEDEGDFEVISLDDEKIEEEEKNKEKEVKKEKEPFALPYWSIYIAYVLVFLTCAVSALFTIFYSLTFGKAKSEGWLSAMMISFWQDVLISQPLKVLVIAVILAIIIKDPDKVDDGNKRSAELGHDEEWIHRDPDGNEKLRLDNFIPKPPGEDMLYEPRQRLLKQKEMKAIIKEIGVYFIYIMVLCVVANGGIDPQAFQISKFTSDVFAGSSYAGSNPLYSVSEPVNFWFWLHKTVIPSLKPKFWYGPYVDQTEELLWTEKSIKRTSRRGWKVKIHKRVSGGGSSAAVDNSTLHKFPQHVIADRGTAYIIGTARLRSLKVRPGDCDIHPALEDHMYSCSSPYSWKKEDERPYFPGWVAANETVQNDLKKDEKSPWVWRSAWDLQGTPYWGIFSTYWGGGYVANVDVSRIQTVQDMQKLELEIWIDRYTRAVFTEFAMYNAYSNFFCIVTMLTEINPTGGYHHYVQFRPIRLYRYTGPEQIVIMAFEIIYVFFLLMFTYSEVKEICRRKKMYFEDPWNYLEALVIIQSFSAIGLYFARLGFGKLAVRRMKENPNDFISFTYVLLLEECQVATMGFAVFCAILKSLRLLRFNRRMSLLTRTVKACGWPLLSFFIMFMVIFLAYVQFAIVVFGPLDEDYSSFTKCISTMMSLTLGGFDFNSLMDNNRILGPVFFFSYMVYVFMILVNVFLSIINDTLAEVKSDVDKQPNDYEIVNFVMHQIKMMVGARVGPAITPLYKPTKTKFAQEVEVIESLAENIEYALSSTLVEDQRQNNWLKSENMSRKKLILFRAVLRLEEDYDEDDLSNLIPLMEEFLIRHTEREVAHIILGETSGYGDDISLISINLNQKDEQGSRHDYEELDDTGSRNYANLYDNVKNRLSDAESGSSENDYVIMDTMKDFQDHKAYEHERGEKEDSQSMATYLSEVSLDHGNARALTPVKERVGDDTSDQEN